MLLNYKMREESILMVEKAIQDSKDYPTKKELWKSLPKKIQYKSFKLILSYLEKKNKIIFYDDKILWIFPSKKLKKIMQGSVRVDI